VDGLPDGTVVRFEHEWGNGNEDDYKPRPCAIIVRGQGPRVFYFPISHEPPRGDDVALEIPEEARIAAGLDAFPQWVIVSRCNRAEWPDGVRTIQGRTTPIYGTLPTEFVKLFRSRIADVSRQHLMRARDRLRS
jgi:hypothetical protein